ncbi:tRNA-binding protein [Armatimonadetes bacterium Uphvl-Ar1]|nr:tRNA-binding protein [Armatimonadetes bacterium Uphvl-Ar1]
MPEIRYSQFEQVELRVGTITNAEQFPEARKPAYKITIDFGPEIGIKCSSAQITHYYTPEQLIGTQIVAVTNFPPKQIGPFISECLVTGFADEHGNVTLTRPEHPVPNGTKLF